MDPLIFGVGVAVVVIAVLALAPRVGVAPPLLLVAVGVALSLVPAFPDVHVEPEWILAGVLPPLLYSTSVSLPTMDFRRDLNAIAGLSVVLVVLTSVGLGVLFSLLLPDVGLATGIALGAVISPTDAVATSIVRRLGVGPRVVTVLEGESLLNDASALVVLRTAIAATAASVSLWGAVGDFFYAVVVAAVVGGVVGRVSLWVRARVAEPHLATAISFTVPFLAYLPAEHLGASGLVATVMAGLVTGVGSARHLQPRDRLTQESNWRTIELLLEGAVFLVMGLEIRAVVEDVVDGGGSPAAAVGLAALGVVVVLVARAAYVALLLWGVRRRSRRGAAIKDVLARVDASRVLVDEAAGEELRRLGLLGGPRAGRDAARRPGRPSGRGRGDDRRPERRPLHESRMARLRDEVTRRVADIDYLAAQPLGVREGAVLTWAGMRGVVTVAAAQTLPADTPQRSLLILIAFTVAAGTLLLQGGTLGLLVRRLGLARAEGADQADAEALVRRVQAVGVALLDSDGLRRADGRPFDPWLLDKVRAMVRRQQEAREEESEARGEGAGDVEAQLRELRLAVLEAQRRELLAIRELGTASSGALNHALAVLDADQIGLELREGRD